jgi:hypothetical protein
MLPPLVLRLQARGDVAACLVTQHNAWLMNQPGA